MDVIMVLWGIIYMLIACWDAYSDPDGWTIAWALTGAFFVILGAVRLYKQAMLVMGVLQNEPIDDGDAWEDN